MITLCYPGSCLVAIVVSNGFLILLRSYRQRTRSTPLDNQVDERLGRRIGVLDPMRGVSAATAAIACKEFGRFVPHGDADGAGGHVHMLNRTVSMGRGRA